MYKILINKIIFKQTKISDYLVTESESNNTYKEKQIYMEPSILHIRVEGGQVI